MPETFKCPQCGALYEVIHDEVINDESPSEDRQAAHCQVCGRAMETRSGPGAPHYELVRMPDGTAI
jgi:transcription elongation factor Elf1